MFKLVAIFAIVIAAANAGIIGHAPAIAIAAPSHASSYANSNLLAIHPAPVAVAHAVHAAPVAVAAPVAIGIGHGALLGGGHGGLIGLGGHSGLVGLGGHSGLVGLGGHGGLVGLGGHGGLIH